MLERRVRRLHVMWGRFFTSETWHVSEGWTGDHNWVCILPLLSCHFHALSVSYLRRFAHLQYIVDLRVRTDVRMQRRDLQRLHLILTHECLLSHKSRFGPWLVGGRVRSQLGELGRFKGYLGNRKGLRQGSERLNSYYPRCPYYSLPSQQILQSLLLFILPLPPLLHYLSPLVRNLDLSFRIQIILNFPEVFRKMQQFLIRYILKEMSIH